MSASDPQRAALDQLADAVLGTVEQVVDPGGERLESTVNSLRRLMIEFVRRYNRLQIDFDAGTVTEPVLFVANHGFGGILDLNVLAVGAVMEDLGRGRRVTFLTHQLAWTLGMGPLVEPLGARMASRESAHEALVEGDDVVVFPGGELDGFKPFTERNLIVFGGRTGFAKLAMDEDVPIVPIVTAGAGESLLALAHGERLARALRLDKLLRVKALPITLSLPWGFSVGGAGLLPYLPLPTKLTTRVLPAMHALPGEVPETYAERVHTAMQDAMTAMTKDRRPLLG